MSEVRLLLWPKWRQVVNSGRNGRALYKSLFLFLLAALFCFAIFWVTRYVFFYIENLNVTGEDLQLETYLRFEINRRLVGMVAMTFVAVLVFSNVITALTTFYLSDDLDLVGAVPVSGDSLFVARFLEMALDSSWMVIVFGTPVFIAFGVVYGGDWLYYLAIPGVLVPFILIPAGLGVMTTMLLVSAFPARRIRDILLLLTVIAAGLLFVLFRFLQPERLAQTEVQIEVVEFIHSLRAPERAWMPNFWLTQVLSQLVRGELAADGRYYLALLWSSGLGLFTTALLLARAIYADGFSKSQEASRVIISKSGPVNRLVKAISHPFGPSTRQMVMKDIRVFMRDTTQWSQLFLLAALVIIYIFNFRVMPLSRFPGSQLKLQSGLSFLNIGLAGFVLSALSARFTFPMVSQEGKAFWIIKTSPLSLRGFLWSKFLISAAPLLLVGETLIVVTNYMLEVNRVVWYASVITIFLMVFSIAGMGVGLGARFPRFNVENPAKVATSFGGVVYMIVAMSVIAAVIALEAGPTYLYFISDLRGAEIPRGHLPQIVAHYGLAALLLVASVFVPMRIGLKWLERLEL